jgi:hypothetical protein
MPVDALLEFRSAVGKMGFQRSIDPEDLYMSSTLCLLAIILYVPALRADEAEDRVEAAVKKLEGSVVRRNDLPGKPIVNVILSMSKVKDDDLKMLSDLKSLSSNFTAPRSAMQASRISPL